MKINLKSHLPVFGVLLFTLLSACHSGHKDSTAVADSANKKQIAAADSATKAQNATTDSANRAKSTLQQDASKFLVKSYEAGMFEVQLSKLAATRALDGDVKNLAATLVVDHIAINANIKAIADAANFVLPADVDGGHQKDLQDISNLTGADFDKKYINTIVSDNEGAVSTYKDAYKNLPSGNTKNFAGQTLPKIEDHLAMAKKVKDRIK